MTFINSELYSIIAEAEQVYRELPFVVNQALVDQLPKETKTSQLFKV